MSDYPQLTEMGVLHPEQIDRFMVNSILNLDVLRIIYQRRKGSLLPVSKTFEFPRVQKAVTDSKGESQTVMETDPELRAAVTELKTLLEERQDKRSLAESIEEELQQLEEEIAMRCESIRELVRKI
jgi:formate-dependent phosphoribosylglycinamide formyltransferase (GAR transformylase)